MELLRVICKIVKIAQFLGISLNNMRKSLVVWHYLYNFAINSHKSWKEIET